MKIRFTMMGMICSMGWGCASSNPRADFYEADTFGPEYVYSPRQSVVFDAASDAPPADWFAYRSDWPSAPRDIHAGETVTYDVYFVDRQRSQGGRLSHGAHTDRAYRVFRSVRSGQAYR
jgi:hypothetical protein